MPRRVLLALLAACAILLAACGDGEETNAPRATPAPAPTLEERPAATTEERTAGGCRPVEAPEPKDVADRARPRLRLDASRRYAAVVRTNCGSFTIALATRESPKTTAAFVALARDGFFDRTTFHRIVPDFVIQGGDPQGDGTGGPGFQVTEAPPDDVQYRKYTVAMAKSDVDPPGASGSQFYVVTDAQGGRVLEPIYAVLGTVTAGRDVVDRLAELPTDPATEMPLEPAVIQRVTIRSSARG